MTGTVSRHMRKLWGPRAKSIRISSENPIFFKVYEYVKGVIRYTYYKCMHITQTQPQEYIAIIYHKSN